MPCNYVLSAKYLIYHFFSWPHQNRVFFLISVRNKKKTDMTANKEYGQAKRRFSCSLHCSQCSVLPSCGGLNPPIHLNLFLQIFILPFLLFCVFLERKTAQNWVCSSWVTFPEKKKTQKNKNKSISSQGSVSYVLAKSPDCWPFPFPPGLSSFCDFPSFFFFFFLPWWRVAKDPSGAE